MHVGSKHAVVGSATSPSSRRILSLPYKPASHFSLGKSVGFVLKESTVAVKTTPQPPNKQKMLELILVAGAVLSGLKGGAEIFKRCEAAGEHDTLAIRSAREVREATDLRERNRIRTGYERWARRNAQPAPADHPFTTRLATKLDGVQSKYTKREYVAQSMVYLDRWFKECPTLEEAQAKEALRLAQQAEVRRARVEYMEAVEKHTLEICNSENQALVRYDPGIPANGGRIDGKRTSDRNVVPGRAKSHKAAPIPPRWQALDEDVEEQKELAKITLDPDHEYVTVSGMVLRPTDQRFYRRLCRRIISASWELLRERDVVALDLEREHDERRAAPLPLVARIRGAWLLGDWRYLGSNQVPVASTQNQQ